MGLFGTDGVRGAFGEAPMDATTVRALGRRLGRTLREEAERPIVVVGGDTRESTPKVFAWLATALADEGVEVRWGGVMPTPAVALLVRRLKADRGIAVSASHNPFRDNGLKIFGPDGFKLGDDEERRLEEGLEILDEDDEATPIDPDPELAPIYIEDLCSRLEARASANGAPLSGLTVALDCANGAVSDFAAAAFERLGAAVHAFHDRPDGRNINQGCGSTHTDEIARRVTEVGADVGFAFDGDADRVLAADASGRILDGDVLLFAWANQLKGSGELDPPRIVATQMSNLGLEESLAASGIGVARCGVGDRAVVALMREDGLTLGGEQSGHLVNLALSTTGDGLQSALHIGRLALEGDLGKWLDRFVRYPQVLLNVRVSSKPDLESVTPIRELAHQTREELGPAGRLLLRYSGTEPLARIMIEGRDANRIEELARRLAERIDAEIGDGDASKR